MNATRRNHGAWAVGLIVLCWTAMATAGPLRELRTVTPQGQPLIAWKTIDYSEEQYSGIKRAAGLLHQDIAQGFRYAYEHTEYAWLNCALITGDSPLVWAKGQTVAVVLSDQTVVPAAVIFAMTPKFEQRPVFLGQSDLRRSSDELWRDRAGREGLASFVFIGFPRAHKLQRNGRPSDWSFDDVTALRVGTPQAVQSAAMMGEKGGRTDGNP